MKRIAASLLATLLLLIPLSARPLALGDIQLRSNLNAPLDARIPLLSATAADIDSIRVALASHEQFERAGVDRPFVLSGLRFEVVTDKGSPYIHVTTQGPVSEPFLNFLLDVDWSKGRAVREYTVLLDPPIYGAAVRRTAEAAVQTVPRNPAPRVAQVAPRQAAPRPAATPAPTPRPASAPASAPASGPTSPPVTSQASSRPAPRAPVPTSQPGTYQVRNNDTLWSLAARFRPRGATIQQTMLAMLERNPEAFENGNVNRLNAGAVLNIPATVDTDQISRTRALAEVKRQHAAWSDYRRSIGSSVPKTPIEVASGGAADAPAGAGGSSADAGRLKIASGGDASGGVGTSQSDSPNVSSLRSELSLVQEEVDRAKRENEELGNKLADAESVIEELRRLVSVQSDEMAALQRQLSGAATVADSAGQAVTGDTPTTAGSGDGSSDGQAGEAGQVGTPTDAMTADAGSTTSDAPADSPADTVADASGADSPGTDSPGTDSSGADSSGADAAETDSSRAMLDTQGAAGDAASGTPMALAGDSTTGDTTSVNTAGGDAGANADAQAPTDAMATSDGSGTASPVMADNSASTDSTTPPVPMPSPTAQPEGFMGKLKAQLDQLPGGAAGILGGSGALLVIVMLIVWLLRRRSTDAEDEEFAMPMSADEMGAPADLADTVADPDAGLAGDTVSEGDETAAAFAGETHHIANAPSTDDDDDDDPLAEVNVYLAYERFEQAESLVRDAIAKEPQNEDYHLKLLEVHYTAKDVGAFETAAAELQAVAGEDSVQMQTAQKWWAELQPAEGGRQLLAGGVVAAGAATAVALATDAFGGGSDDDDFVETAKMSPDDAVSAAGGDDIDFDLGFGTEEASADGGVDFDLGFDDSEPVAAGEDTRVDFDLDFGDEETPASTDLDLDFDQAEVAATEDAVADAGGDLDFDLEAFGDDEPKPTAADTDLDFDLSDFGEEGDGDALDEIAAELEAPEVGSSDADDFGSMETKVLDSTIEPDDASLAAAASELSSELDAELDTGLEADASLDVIDDDAGDEITAELDPPSDDADTDVEIEMDDLEIGQMDVSDDDGMDLDLDAFGEIDDEPGSDSDTLERPVELAETDLDFALELGSPTDDVSFTTDNEDVIAAVESIDDGVLDLDIADDSNDLELGDVAEEANDTLLGGATMDLTAALQERAGDTSTAELVGDAATMDLTPELTNDFDQSLEDELRDTEIGFLGEDSNDPPAGESVQDIDLDFDLGFEDEGQGDEISTVEMESAPTNAPSIDGELDLDLGELEAPDPDDSLVTRAVENDESIDFDLDLIQEDQGDSVSIDEEFADLFATSEDDFETDDDTMPLDDIELDVQAQEMSLDIPGAGEDLELDEEFKGLFEEADAMSSDELSEASALEDPNLDLDALLDGQPAGGDGVSPKANLDPDEITDLNFDGVEPIVRGPDPELDFDLEEEHPSVDPAATVSGTEIDQVQTKLDLAQAYIDMGDMDGAKGILDEVMRDGSDTQKGEAQSLLDSIS